MCASWTSLLLVFLLVPFRMKLVAEGLPYSKQERGIDQDIIAGEDFLSVLMDSPAVRQVYRELSTKYISTTTIKTAVQIPSHSFKRYRSSRFPAREQRSRRSTTVEAYSFTQIPDIGSSQVLPISKEVNLLNSTEQSSDSKTNGSLIVSVLVSSSEGNSRINRIPQEYKVSTRSTTEAAEATTFADQSVVASEEHPSILVAQASKSEFTVDEKEPITSSSDVFEGYTHEYPANVQPLPSPQQPPKESFEHHSVIYHDDPRESMRGRSVSYSAVIQTLPKSIEKPWTNPSEEPKERQERHYDLRDAANDNHFDKPETKEGHKNAYHSGSVAESNNFYVTRKYDTNYHHEANHEQKETNWEQPETYLSHLSKITEHTETNWGALQNNSPTTITSKLPVIYGKPELNYEVDESVSVMTNGRAHGIQPIKSPVSTPAVEVRTGQSNDSQKVGYVVEGRNYRKYRVEERTSDGFIVGEYGVVNHDDGALRGVRYTADGSVNPRLIYNALMKFLSL